MPKYRYIFSLDGVAAPMREDLDILVDAGEAARAHFKLTYGEYAALKLQNRITRKTEVFDGKTWKVVPIPPPRLHSI